MNEWLAVNTVDFFNEVCSSCFVEVLRGSGPRCADQLVVRHHCRVLYRRVVPGDESLGVRAVVPYPCSASMPSLSLALAASTSIAGRMVLRSKRRLSARRQSTWTIS